MKTLLLPTLVLVGLIHSGIAAISDSCSVTLRFIGSSPAPEGEHNYRFAFTNRFSHPVYYLAHRRDVAGIAGQPFHYESFRRWGCWGSPEYQFRDVRMDFRRVRVGETISFPITRRKTFWPWRATVAFYARPDYNGLRGDVSSDPISK